MIAINRCVYNKFCSVDFDLLCDVAFDSDHGESDSFLNREAIASESHNGHFKRVHNYKYGDVFAPTFTFIKRGFGNFSFEEQRKILSWLTSKSTASFLTVYYDDSEVVSFELLGAFTDIKTYKLANGRTVGFTAVFESVTPWALSPIKTTVLDVSNQSVEIELSLDEPETPIYPYIAIEQDNISSVVPINKTLTKDDMWIPGTVYYFKDVDSYYWIDPTTGEKQISKTNDANIETTSVLLKNVHTNDVGMSSEFISLTKNNIKGETIILDGTNKVVSSSRTNGRIFGDDFVNWNWLPLCDGKNSISMVGNCTVTMKWREPIKIGEF